MVDTVAILESGRRIMQLANNIENEQLRRDLVVEAAAIIMLIELSPDAQLPCPRPKVGNSDP
jgi:hypothetical protein